jgi:hypothetical protein
LRVFWLRYLIARCLWRCRRLGHDNTFVGSGGEYVAFHIRRGDFQHKQTQWDAEKILQSTLRLIDVPSSRTVYISTDEGNSRYRSSYIKVIFCRSTPCGSFFEPFHKAFNKVFFLNDFMETATLTELNPNHIGMVEQVQQLSDLVVW